MRLTIDTEKDTYDQAVATVQAAYGKRPPARPADHAGAPAVEARPDPQHLSDADLGNGWSERRLFDVIAAIVPRAREVIRRIVDLGGQATYASVQQHLAPVIPRSQIGGVLTSISAVERRLGPASPASPASNAKLLQRDERTRIYTIDQALLEPLRKAFALADVRPDLLRRGEPG